MRAGSVAETTVEPVVEDATEEGRAEELEVFAREWRLDDGRDLVDFPRPRTLLVSVAPY